MLIQRYLSLKQLNQLLPCQTIKFILKYNFFLIISFQANIWCFSSLFLYFPYLSFLNKITLSQVFVYFIYYHFSMITPFWPFYKILAFSEPLYLIPFSYTKIGLYFQHNIIIIGKKMQIISNNLWVVWFDSH